MDEGRRIAGDIGGGGRNLEKRRPLDQFLICFGHRHGHDHADHGEGHRHERYRRRAPVSLVAVILYVERNNNNNDNSIIGIVPLI